MFNKDDIRQIESRGSSPASAMAQVELFKKGFPWMKILAPATPGKGICVLDEEEVRKAAEYYENARINGKCKFVPASGAASRMFKDLFSGLDKLKDGEDVPADSPAAKFVSAIERFAFYDEKLFGKPEDTAESRKDILSKTLTEDGLNYGAKPKGVLKFHKYPDGEVRTAFAEHLVEAQNYMRNTDGSANIVVTISPEHKQLFEEAYAAVKDEFEKRYGVKYNITFTYQDKATDTIAVAKYKKVLLGKAVELRDKIFGYLMELDAVTNDNLMAQPYPNIPGMNSVGADKVYQSTKCQLLCNDIENFLLNELCIQMPQSDDCKTRVMRLREKLNRPIRVCGMVKNQGEPGGGPFIIAEKDGSTSLQILEGAQINKDDLQASAALAAATHFNPVDIVCCLHNYKGESFDLLKHVDNEAGFISSKSYQGRELKALELPGLWNGSMSDWNTLFVEVPLETFNPVKVVLDLLRPAHQAE